MSRSALARVIDGGMGPILPGKSRSDTFLALAGLAIVLVFAYHVEKPPAAADDRGFRAVRQQPMDAKLKQLLVADILARWAEEIPKVFVIFYVMRVLK